MTGALTKRAEIGTGNLAEAAPRNLEIGREKDLTGEIGLVAGPEGINRGQGVPVIGRTVRRSRGGMRIVTERKAVIVM